MRVLFLLIFCSVAAMAQELQKGVVIPAIQFEESTSYALYLPTTYNPNQKYPTVFIFDEDGQGAQAAQLFSIGASLTQSIVVAPNYKMSDSLNLSVKQTADFINTIHDRYAVDVSKIILAGEGRGAIIASTNAHISEDVYGVIAINDVFIDEKILEKNGKARFVILNNDTRGKYFTLKGYEKRYSFREKLLGYYEFESEDQWPDAGYLSAALIDFLETDATEEQTKKYYSSELAFGNSLYKKRRHLEAFAYVSELKKQYKKKLDLKEQKELLATVRGNTTYKVSRLQRNAVAFEEQVLLEDFYYFIEEDVQKAYFDNLGWWNYQMDELDAIIDSTAQNNFERKSAQRLKSFVQQKAEEKYDLYTQASGSLEQLLFINILRTLVRPDNQDAFLQCISLSAKEGDVNAALFYLEELLRTGYKDYETLYAIDGTTAIRISEEYNEIVKAYLGKSKFFDTQD